MIEDDLRKWHEKKNEGYDDCTTEQDSLEREIREI